MPAGGAGTAAVGVTVAGYGGVDAAPIQQPTILIDATDGVAKEGRKLDPVTGQYVYDTYGRVQGMSGIQQLVLMRAKTLLNSSAVKGLGMAAPSGTITPDILRRLRDDIVASMKDLIAAKLISVEDVRVEFVEGTKAVRRFFLWRDMTANQNKGGLESTNF